MTVLASLWLPILISVVAVFVASWALHMLPLWHKNDYPAVPNEAAARAALAPLAIPPGEYMLPRCKTHAEMRTPEFMEKLNQGPVMILTVVPNGPPRMGKMLAQWTLYVALVTGFAACLARHALADGANPHRVFHHVAFAAFGGHALALVQMSIWYRRSWGSTLKAALDGLIYAAITGLIFAWRWPGG